MSNLSDIGFPTPDEQAINEMIMHVLEVAETVKCERGFYLIYTDESGAEIYLQGNLQQELIGFNPHFRGKSRRRIGLTKVIERDSSELDGGYEAWANPEETESELAGDYPFVFDVPDFRLVENSPLPRAAEIQLTAFASNDFKIFDGEKEYDDSQQSEAKFAAKSFVSLATFQPDNKTTAEPPRPVATMTGEIKEYELKTNQLSGENFYWLLIETYGGEIDIVADPKLITAEPKTGGIVSGHFWLTGRIV